MERSRDWMDQAESDLRHAKSSLEQGFYDWACFSSQRAAEKAVKRYFKKAYIPTPYPNAHPSGSPSERYTAEGARRLMSYAEKILNFCTDLLSRV